MRKRIIILVASLLVFLICYYAQTNNNMWFGPAGYLHIKPSEVSSVTIFFNEKTYGFVRENKGWKLLDAGVYGFDQKYFAIFLKDLCTLPKTQTISNNSEELGLFGLEVPEIRIKITYGTDKRRVCLFLGRDNEASTSTYAKVEGSNEIVLLGKILKESIGHIIERL